MSRPMLLACIVVALGFSPTLCAGQTTWAEPIAEASKRTGLSTELIAAVMEAESGGDAKAVSSRGAMGLMQLMPATWAEMRARLSLGVDPFEPRDNVLAGATYLRWLLDRYGSPGFLAAYNAGPGRYEASLSGRALPPETLAYVDKLQGRAATREPSPDWRSAGLFASTWSSRLGPPRSERPGS
jgi:soluble lytic murein transglycosylase-like protein